MSKAPMFEVSGENQTPFQRRIGEEHHGETSVQGTIDYEITKTINENLDEARARKLQHEEITCYMYKVPWCLKDPENDRCFSPRLVSIGPYHHGEPHLESMQFHKYRVLDCLLKRTDKDISYFLDVIKALEHEAWASYQDLPKPSFSRDKFLEVLLLDACFVLEFLVGRYQLHHTELGYDKSDPIFTKLNMYCGIDWDMILLENQIPLFILNKLYEAIHNSPHDDHVVKLMVDAFNRSWVMGRVIPMPDHVFSSLKARRNRLSCMEIFWKNLIYEYEGSNDVKIALPGKIEERPNTEDLEQHTIPCVTALDEAGVIFKFKNTLPFWEIDFKDGVLEIPQIVIHEASESIFLNLMAYEQHHVNVGDCKITKYILFMDSLVNSASDLGQLRARGIIVCAGRSDEEIKNMLNRLGRRAYIPFNQFEKLSEEIHKYCHKNINVWRAKLLRDYFNNPWAIISVIGAIVLLLAAILETGYTAAKYHQKH